MVGEQAYGLRNCARAPNTPQQLLQRNVTAKVIAETISRACGNYVNYRLAIVTQDGQIEGFIARGGCHANNKE